MSSHSTEHRLLRPKIIVIFIIIAIISGLGIWYKVSKDAAEAREQQKNQEVTFAERMYGVGRVLVILSTVQQDFERVEEPIGEGITQSHWVPQDAESVQHLKQAMDEYNKTASPEKRVEADGFVKLVSSEGLKEFVKANKNVEDTNYYDFAVWCKQKVDLVSRSNGQTYLPQTVRHPVSQYEYYSDSQLLAEFELRSQWNTEHPDNQK